MNLPNALTVGRIACAPLIAILPFTNSWTVRLTAFVLFIFAAVTDWFDGYYARTRKEETDLGRLLDPLADKLLLVATLVPMFVLTGSGGALSLWSPHRLPLADGVLGPMTRGGGEAFPFHTPVGPIGLPWWILAVVLGREAFMTVFRQFASRRGVIIASIGSAKWKTGFQSTWVGAAFFWFWSATLAADAQWTSAAWRGFAYFNGTVGVLTMVAAAALSLHSLVLYLRRYGGLLSGRRPVTPVRAKPRP